MVRGVPLNGGLEKYQGHARNLAMGAFVDEKKIMIVDEAGFGRVCCALLEMYGYTPDYLQQCQEFKERCNPDQYGLVILSYPYGSEILSELSNYHRVKTIVLSDYISSDLLARIKGLSQVVCLTKPLDFSHFRDTISRMMPCQSPGN